VFGAGILSSTGEIPHSLFSPDATRRPFVTETVIATDYDPSQMQKDFFVGPVAAVPAAGAGGAGAPVRHPGAVRSFSSADERR
jgi:hypothetical protein